jgi:hypothetical protein
MTPSAFLLVLPLVFAGSAGAGCAWARETFGDPPGPIACARVPPEGFVCRGGVTYRIGLHHEASDAGSDAAP